MLRCVRSLFDLSLQFQDSGQRQLQILSGIRLLYKHHMSIHALKYLVYVLQFWESIIHS